MGTKPTREECVRLREQARKEILKDLRSPAFSLADDRFRQSSRWNIVRPKRPRASAVEQQPGVWGAIEKSPVLRRFATALYAFESATVIILQGSSSQIFGVG